MSRRHAIASIVCGLWFSAAFPTDAAVAGGRPDLVVADFEGADYGGWTATGIAFGGGPTAGALPDQMPVGGFAGDRFANSYHGGDSATGTLTSPPFRVERGHLNFLVGGGGFAGETCVNLLVGEEVVRTATGPNVEPGGSEDLRAASWDLSDLSGATVRVRLVDARAGGWGHVTADRFVLSDAAAEAPAPAVAAGRALSVVGSHLLVPVSNVDTRAGPTRLELRDGDRLVQAFDVTLPRGDGPAWTAAYPLDRFRGGR